MRTLFVLTTLLLFSTPSHAELQSCGQISNIEGTDCSALNVQFDVSECGDSQGSTVPRVICKSGGATAELKTEKNVFRTTLENADGKWKASGKVWQFPRKSGASMATFVAPVTPEGALPLSTVTAKPLSLESKTNVPEEAYDPPNGVKKQKTSSGSMAVEAGATSESALSGFKLSALIDVYYGYNMNGGAPAQHTGNPGTVPNGNTSLRYYDQYSDQIQLSLAEITIKKETDTIGMLLDLDFGTSADINGANPPYSASTSTSDTRTDEMSKHVGQAVISYKPAFLKGFVFEAGKMATHVGLETMKAKDNWNYSRSTLYAYGIPLWHSGARIGLEVMDKFLWLNAYVYNGWNSMYENNHSKSLGGQIKIVGGELFTATLNYLGGPEKNLDDVNKRQIYEANLVLNLPNHMSFQTDWLNGNEEFVLDAATGERRTAHWKSNTFALKWSPIDWFSLTPRYEIYDDIDGYTLSGYGNMGFGQTLTSWTVTSSFALADTTELRFEWRQDQSSKSDRFMRSDFQTTSEQTTYSAALLSSF